MNVDVFHARRQNHLLLGKHETENIEQLLKFVRRRLHAASRAPDIKTSAETKRVESANAGHHDPVYPTVRMPVPPAARRDRSAATRWQEPGQPFLHRFRIVVYADDLSRIFDPENNHPAVRIRKGADYLADGGEIETAHELGSQILPGLDA